MSKHCGDHSLVTTPCVFALHWSRPPATEKAMPPHSSTLAWKIPWMEEPGRLQSMGSGTTERLQFHFSLSCLGERNGNPLQCSCLENPRDEGTWWAAVYGVAQSQTRLKRLSSRRRVFESLWLRGLKKVFRQEPTEIVGWQKSKRYTEFSTGTCN